MILDTTGSGPLGMALRGAIEGSGEPIRSAPVEDPDLIVHATGCRAIVYAASSVLLDGKLSPSPNPERMQRIVRASNALTVQLVVAILPRSDVYEQELAVLKSDGVPYVILRSAPLLEELARAVDAQSVGRLWLARGKKTAIATSSDLAMAVLQGIRDDSLQGRTIDVQAESLDVAEAMERAASLGGKGLKVHATSPRLSGAYRRLSSWLGRPDPPGMALYEKIIAASN